MMRNPTKLALCVTAAALAAAVSMHHGAQAQEGEGRAAGHVHAGDPHDLSGVYFVTEAAQLNSDRTVKYNGRGPKALPHSRVLWTSDDKEPPFTAWGKAKFDASFNGAINNEPIADPSTDCLPHGMPRIMIAPYPMQIVQTPGQITMMFEVNHNVRYIPMNRVLPRNPKITMMGESSGHWEGDTLVIETVGSSGKSIFDEIGTPHSDKRKITERLRWIKNNTQLEDLMTFEDPIAYTKPWVGRAVLAWRPDIQITEYVCEENNRNVSNADGKTTAR